MGLPIDLTEDRLELGVQGVAVAGKRTRCRLRSQRSRTVDQQRDVIQSTVDRLKSTETVRGVANTLPQYGNIGPESVCDRQSGGVIRR